MTGRNLPGRSQGRWYWPLLLSSVLLILVVEELFTERGGRWVFWAVTNLLLAQVLTFLAGYHLRSARAGAAAGRPSDERQG